MPKFYLFCVTLLFSFLTLKAQVNVIATAGTTSGSYVNLKAAFDAINDGDHRGDITILISASVTETLTARLDSGVANVLADYTSIHIMPTAACTISGNINGPLIDLNGADKVTIDGRINGAGTMRSLTLKNTYSAVSSDISTIRMSNGASFDTIQYVNVQGSAQGYETAIICIADSYRNAVDNNDIGPAGTNRAGTGICATNHLITFSNTSNVISHNLIHDFYSTNAVSAGVTVSQSDNYTITGNSIYQTLPVTGDMPYFQTFIAVNYGKEHVISNNFIGGSAPLAEGAPADYHINSGVRGITVYATDYTTITKLDGNVIRNFSFSFLSSTKIISGFTGMSVSSGSFEVGLIEGNTVGSLTKNGDITLSYAGDFVSSGITAIACSGSVLNNTVNLQNNKVGSVTVNATQGGPVAITGIACNDFTTARIQNNIVGGPLAASIQNNAVSGSITGISISQQINTSQGICTQNTIQHLFNNCSGSSTAITSGIISLLGQQSGSIVKSFITDNQIRDLHSADKSAGDGSVRGVHLKSYSGTTTSFMNSTISRNQISNLLSESIGSSTVVEGVNNESPFNLFLNIDSNHIHHLSNAAANINTFSQAAVQGIKSFTSANAPVSITANKIYELSGTSSAATWVTGISCLYGSNSNVLTLSKNHIYRLTNDSSPEGVVSGIHVKGANTSGIFTIKNNMISLMPDQVKVYGIYSSAKAASLNLYYNSVEIGGVATGSNRSGSFYRSSTDNSSPVIAKNNIFYNIRHGGTGNHYALMNDNITPDNGWDSLNFNNHYSDNAATVALWGNSPLSFSNYVISSQQDTNSQSIAVDFADPANGDLHLLNTNNNQTLAGIAVAGINDDIDGDARHPNPAIGADEIAISFPLPVLTASGPLSFCSGDHVILSSSVSKGNQWYKDGIIIPGATAQSYQVDQTGVYNVSYMYGFIQLASDTVNVKAGTGTISDTTVSDVLCAGTATGAIRVTISDDAALTYTWSNGSHTKDLTDAVAGTYRLVISNNAGCKDSLNFAITQPDTLKISETHVGINCINHNAGSIDLTVSGGTPPYSYRWSTGDITEDLTRISGGNLFTATITDANKCTKQIIIPVITCGLPKTTIAFPNPVTDVLHVKITGYNEPNSMLAIYDRSGNKVIEKKVAIVESEIFTIDLQRLPPGLYGLKIITPAGEINKWFMKVE